MLATWLQIALRVLSLINISNVWLANGLKFWCPHQINGYYAICLDLLIGVSPLLLSILTDWNWYFWRISFCVCERERERERWHQSIWCISGSLIQLICFNISVSCKMISLLTFCNQSFCTRNCSMWLLFEYFNISMLDKNIWNPSKFYLRIQFSFSQNWNLLSHIFNNLC